MTTADGRPYRIDCLANPDTDGPSILIQGFPAGYLAGATVTAPVRHGRDPADAAWSVAVGATSITLSMPQADVAAIGYGTYTWSLLMALASGGKPPVVGGFLSIDNGFAPTYQVLQIGTIEIDPIGVDVALTFTQVLTDALTILTGGNAAGSGTDIITGGSA